MTTAAMPSVEDGLAHARETVKKSGTSFAAGMRILSKPRRDAMHAIYAFCREVDDIADSDAPVADKRRALGLWRAEIDRLYAGAPETPTGVALLPAMRAFDLPMHEFILMIEGMEMDAEGPIVAPPMSTLFAYTRRVAGAVGMLSMPVFGAPCGDASDRFALSLADALQLTNILRDVAEDAETGRLYLPRELLVKHDAPKTPDAILESPALPDIAREFGQIAARKFAEAREALGSLDWRVLRPALLMMGVYEGYLEKMQAKDWTLKTRPSLSRLEKAAIAARWFVAPKLNKAPRAAN